VNACLFVLCMSLGSTAAEPPRDRFFGEDKLKHYFTSFVATSLAASAARFAGLDTREAVVVGAGAGTLFGAGKEVLDLRRPGARFGASLNDMVWNLAGVGTAAAIGLRTE
jgi:uncharacterized protein YfiM (DUF2279 family)